MNIKLPVQMVPIAPSMASTAGFVVAVLLGLALYANSQQQPTTQPKK